MDKPGADLLTAREAAAMLRVSLRTLERLEVTCTGPRRIALSRRRFAYRRRDVLAWIEGRPDARAPDVGNGGVHVSPSATERMTEIADAIRSGEHMASIAARHGVSATRVRQIYLRFRYEEERKAAGKDDPDLIEKSSLSLRARYGLLNGGYVRFSELRGMAIGELRETLCSLPNFGPVSYSKVVEHLGTLGVYVIDDSRPRCPTCGRIWVSKQS